MLWANSVAWFLLCTDCPKGLYGPYCSEKCDCVNNAVCDAVSGQCICLPGYMGDTCERGKCLFAVKFSQDLICYIYFRTPCLEHQLLPHNGCIDLVVPTLGVLKDKI